MAIALSPASPTTRGERGLHRAGRRRPRQRRPAALECWWGERRCAAAWGDHARPDGYGRWAGQVPGQPAAVTDFFLEYDTGTESLTPAVGKLAGYAALAARTGITTPVLFRLPSPRREAALHARLAGPPPPGIRDAASAAQIPGVPVATAAPGTSPHGPAGAAWLPAGAPARGCGSPSSPRPAPPRPDGGPDGEADRARPARRPGLAPAGARPARLERPARRAPPRPGRR